MLCAGTASHSSKYTLPEPSSKIPGRTDTHEGRPDRQPHLRAAQLRQPVLSSPLRRRTQTGVQSSSRRGTWSLRRRPSPGDDPVRALVRRHGVARARGRGVGRGDSHRGSVPDMRAWLRRSPLEARLLLRGSTDCQCEDIVRLVLWMLCTRTQ